MTGPEHRTEAERLITEANRVGHRDPQRGDGILRAAQVHATLATIPATPRRGDEFEAWIKRQRDEFSVGSYPWNALDELLGSYRLHADTGTPLGRLATEQQPGVDV
jgi:hypothetical protein